MELLKKNNPFIGVGLRTEHYTYLENSPETKIDYFEAISENHMDSFGRPLYILELIAKDYPLSFHGVSLSIASSQALNEKYLSSLKTLYDIFNPFFISDHLCWTGLAHSNTHNLLPFAYNNENLNYIVSKINKVQDFLKRPLGLENLSAYFDWKGSTYTEWEFIAELMKRSGCLWLLDVNNIYVNSQNHQFDPFVYIDAIDMDRVGQIHLAGFTDMGDFLFDTHSRPVHEDVWKLYEYTLKKANRNIPTLLEWDEDIPSFEEVQIEALKAREFVI
ncbi:MAG: DUF692 domain-containing protein [Halobacteriovoraceae bacterium]|nr:DUF692 domain-containing protein [Halobacteriovoraceae bacterium]